MSRVLLTLAVRLRDAHGEDAPDGAGDPARTSNAERNGRLPRGGFGPRPNAVLGLGGLDAQLGVTAGDVARACDMTASNAHTVLRGLEKAGALQVVSGERPIRWRRRAG